MLYWGFGVLGFWGFGGPMLASPQPASRRLIELCAREKRVLYEESIGFPRRPASQAARTTNGRADVIVKNAQGESSSCPGWPARLAHPLARRRVDEHHRGVGHRPRPARQELLGRAEARRIAPSRQQQRVHLVEDARPGRVHPREQWDQGAHHRRGALEVLARHPGAGRFEPLEELRLAQASLPGQREALADPLDLRRQPVEVRPRHDWQPAGDHPLAEARDEAAVSRDEHERPLSAVVEREGDAPGARRDARVGDHAAGARGRGTARARARRAGGGPGSAARGNARRGPWAAA